MNETLEIIPTRLSLLSRLKDLGNEDGWKDFFDTYWRLIYTAAIRSGLTPAESQDVVQEAIISVTRNIEKYDPQSCSFKSWLLNLTRWRVIDQHRKRLPVERAPRRAHTETHGTDALARVPDPALPEIDLCWDEEWAKNLISVAIERLKNKIEPRHFQVFDLVVMKEWSAGEAAKALKLNTPQVYLIKHRVTRLLAKEIKLLEQASH